MARGRPAGTGKGKAAKADPLKTQSQPTGNENQKKEEVDLDLATNKKELKQDEEVSSFAEESGDDGSDQGTGRKKRNGDDSYHESSESESEPISDASSGSDSDSDSDYGKKKNGGKKGKAKKKKVVVTPTRRQPKRAATSGKKKRGKFSDESSDEDEVPTKKPKVSPRSNRVAKTKAVNYNEEETEEQLPSTSQEEKNGSGSQDTEKGAGDLKATGNESGTSGQVANEEVKIVEAQEDFSCPEAQTKDGKMFNFKVCSWNVAGANAWVKKNGIKYLKLENPDIACLQEHKCSEAKRPTELLAAYPYSYWTYSSSAGRNGVVTLSKIKPLSVTRGFPIEGDDETKLKKTFNEEGRLLNTEFEKFYILNGYVPNGGRPAKDEKYPPRVTNGERQAWDKLLREYVKNLELKKPVILAGDLNVAHEPIDLANPTTNTSTAGFTKEERQGLTDLLKQTSLFDSFRALHPTQAGAYTFWSYMRNCRQKNIGWRLDYFLLSDTLKDSLCEVFIRDKIIGSDHCPLVLCLCI